MRININAQKILGARGLGASNDARRFLAATVERLSLPYTPMAAGSGAHMNASPEIAPDGSTITYRDPHAHYVYVGEGMVGSRTGSAYARSGEPKVYNGKALQYHGAPRRGPEWEKRMMRERKGDVLRDFAKFVGGKPK